MIQKIYTDRKINRLGGSSIYKKLYKGSGLIFEYADVSQLSVSDSTIKFAKTGETKTITIYSNDTWQISSIPAWATLSQTTGVGTTNITITAESTTETRENNIVVSTVSKSISISISQKDIRFVNWIYTTQSDGDTYCINTGIIPSTADTIDVIWKVHYQGGYHIATYKQEEDRTWYNWRVFNISNTLYYDYNEGGSRISKSSFKPTTAETLNWEIGNQYIKNKSTGANIVSGTQKSTIGSGRNYSYALGLAQSYFKEFKVTRNGNVLFYGKAALDNNDIPCIYDTVSETYKYYNGTQAYLTYDDFPHYKKLTDISEINSASTYFILYDSSAVSYDAIIQGFTDVNIISDSLIDLPNEDPQDSYLNIFRFKYKNGKIYRLSKQNTYYRYETILYPEYNNNTYTFFAYYPGDEPEYPSNITINFINYNNEVRMTLNDGTRTYTFGERGTYPVPRFSNGTGYAIYELIN